MNIFEFSSFSENYVKVREKKENDRVNEINPQNEIYEIIFFF